ncbi:MAG: serine hydrolase [Saprospiraceae bacterium]|nr:serine hydrolase [Saprospiraceae bacterium]
MRAIIGLLCSAILTLSGYAQVDPLGQVLDQMPDSLRTLVDRPEEHQVQIMYTRIDRDEDNRPLFTTFTHGLDTSRYFYPASTVKLPTALLALEKLNHLRIIGLDRETPMYTGTGRPPQQGVAADSSAATGLPSVAHYIKKIFLVSDNEAYNRLYEFLGQAALNEKLHARGFESSRIIHRLSAPQFDSIDNRYTNPVLFRRSDTLLYFQGEVFSRADAELDLQDQIRGKGYIDREGKLIKAPFDFRHKNHLSLPDLHDILKVVLFPESASEKQRFDLSRSDYEFVYRYMSMLPRESDEPAYPQYQNWDGFVKFLLYGDTRDPIPDHIRIFNKVGDAYGFLTDAAYVVDFKNGVEFILAASVHVNENQIFNDGVYEYDDLGFPFLATLGRLIYAYELQRERKVSPDLSRFDLH